MFDNFRQSLQEILDHISNVSWAVYNYITTLAHWWFSMILAEILNLDLLDFKTTETLPISYSSQLNLPC